MQRELRRLRLRVLGLSLQSAGHLASLLPSKKLSVDREVVIEAWDAVADGGHNSNTDLIYWNDWFFLAHQTSPYHMGSSRSRLLVWRSKDARSWQKVTVFKASRGEYRDPKFAAIGDKLMLYCLPNLTLLAEPVTTAFSQTQDGTSWTEMAEIEPAGWLFWRPKTVDGKAWYATAYWHEHGKSILLRSPDGLDWDVVSQVYEGERNDETDFEFLPDGRIIATGRLEGNGSMFGDASASTFIALSSPPYNRWSVTKSQVTRLDGPCLFSFNDRVYALGRYQASRLPRLAEQGGIFSRKRTSLFRVREDGLLYLTDLASAGDTSYSGIAITGNEAYVSYYTSPIDRDPTWVVGMFGRTDIRMARISLLALERLALSRGG